MNRTLFVLRKHFEEFGAESKERVDENIMIELDEERTQGLLKNKKIYFEVVFRKDDYKSGQQTVVGTSSNKQVKLCAYVEVTPHISDGSCSVIIEID